MNTHYAIRVLASLALAACANPALPAELTVATTGKDTNPGTRSRPFATVGRARDAARAVRAARPSESVTVTIRGGMYYLRAPLTLDTRDSNTTFRAMTGETVTLSGGRPIRGWKQQPDGTWSAPSPGGFFRQLFVNGARAVRARWPNADGELTISTADDAVKAFTLSQAIPGADLAGERAELVVYENWSITRGLVTASSGASVSTATPMGWIGHGPMTTASPGKPAFLEHGRAFLDRSGEWYLDASAGQVLYLPLPGEKPSATIAVAPQLERLVVLGGAAGKPVRNVRFVGLRFEHTEFPLPAFGYNEIQAGHHGTTTTAPTHVQPVAIECCYAEDCRFEQCAMSRVGASGMGFGPGCRRNLVSRCALSDIGGNGIMIGWRGKGRLSGGTEGALDADWTDPSDAPQANEVSDCRIERCGAFSQGCVGIFAAFSADTRIAHNLVHNMPYTGMSIGYRWNTTPTSQTRCVVENNHIHDVMKLLADGGGIYSLGFQPGTILRSNHIHNVHRSGFAHGGAPNNGFFVDEGSKSFLFDRNLVHDTSGEPVRFNQCAREWHTWTDNILGWDGVETPAVRAIRDRAGPRP